MKLEYIEFLSGDTKRESPEHPTKIDTNINFSSVDFSNSQLVMGFDYLASYTPGNNYIRLTGKAVFTGTELKKIKSEWDKEKRLSGKEGEFILNAINYNSALNALLIAKAFSMTPPVMLPTINLKS